MRILITGGAGFVGSNIAFHLNSNGHKVTVFDNLVRRGSELNINKFKQSGIEFIHGDIRNIEDFNQLKVHFDFIFETAAQPSVWFGYQNPSFDITNNYNGLLNVLEYARKNKSKMIFWSTNKVYPAKLINSIKHQETQTRYKFLKGFKGINENFSIDGNDHGIYGLSKVCADLTCQEWSKAFNIPIIINRFSCIAGPGQFGKTEQGWVTWFVIAAMFELPVTIYGFKGKQVRDVLFIRDLLNLVDLQMNKINSLKGQVFNIGGGFKVNTSLLEIIEIIEKLTGKKISRKYIDKEHKADHRAYISDISKAKRLLKWEPKIDMKEGLIDIIDWVDKNKECLKKLYCN